ncbi:hypothetical protein NQ317_017219, partial [Molorchus minor]
MLRDEVLTLKVNTLYIEKFGLNSVDVKDILLEMRKYRMGLIQTPEQLRFSYQAIIEGSKQIINPNIESEQEKLEDIINNISNTSEDRELSDEDDEPPPLPPPRMDSLRKQNGTPLDRPLPTIPKSVSDNDLSYENEEVPEKAHIPSGPLPVVPSGEEEHSEEDELESSLSDNSEVFNSVEERLSPAELRQRKRIERKEYMEAQVRDMKR